MIARNDARELVYTIVPSPVGDLKLVASELGLAAVVWDDEDPRRVPIRAKKDARHPVLRDAARQLSEYFAGTRRSFDLPLDFAGTPFQKRVWNALLTIPFGETRSYGEIAAQLGDPKAVRAVGAANGKNPLAIVAPCHRVIGSTGSLIGFGGGLPRKAHLLGHEQSVRGLPLAEAP